MTRLNGMELLFADDAPPQAQQVASPQPAQRLDGNALLFGSPDTTSAAPDKPKQSWGEWAVDLVRGKHDPAYKDLPAFDTYKAFAPNDYMGGGQTIDNAPFLGADDQQLADVIKQNLGGQFVGMKSDANGYPIVTYRDQHGAERSAYVNKPGLDLQDVGRAAKGAVPYLLGGGHIAAATKGAPLAAQASLQALGGMAISAAGDAALQPLGSEQGINAEKSLITGAAAGIGKFAEPLVGAFIRKVFTEPGLIDNAGRLTARGAAAAKQAGIDPAGMDPAALASFAREFARTGDAAAAGRAATSGEFGIQKTLGEQSGRADQLLREQRVRGGTYGESPAQAIKSFDDSQHRAMGNAFSGDMPVPSQGANGITNTPTIAKRIAPDRGAGDYNPTALGGGIRSNLEAASAAAKKAEGEAWAKVGTIMAPDEAMADLPGIINKALGDRVISAGAGTQTRVAAKMVDSLTRFMKGEAPEQAADWLAKHSPRNVDQMRRHLGGMVSDAATPSDRAAARAIYNGYNDWIRESADKLAQTNANGAANLVIARGISKEAKDAIQATAGTPGSRIMAAVLEKEDTPEGVIRALFASKPGAHKNGVANALGSLKDAYDKYLPKEAAKAAWDDVRLAYWLRLTQAADGKPVGAQQFLTNIGKARSQEGTVYQMLLSNEERAAIGRLAYAVTGIEKKNLNRSWTGPSVGGMFNDITKALGFNTFAGRFATNLVAKPINYAKGQAEVGRALSSGAQSTLPNYLSPFAAAAGSSYGTNDH